MYPIVLDLTRVSILLIGQGELLEKRKKQLEEYGAAKLVVSTPAAMLQHWQNSQVIMIAGLNRSVSETISAKARADGKLVNVEDINDLCDFYFTANVRRGELVIAVSTSGASPTLARKVRDRIAGYFGAEWGERVRILSDLRKSLKAGGAGMKEIIEKTETFLVEKGWLA